MKEVMSDEFDRNQGDKGIIRKLNRPPVDDRDIINIVNVALVPPLSEQW